MILHYEYLNLAEGHRFLEIGLGSGYSAIVAREIVGDNGLVVSVEIDPSTFEFGKKNIENSGYNNIFIVKGDGGLGYPELAPYDRISVTAACTEIPPPLIEQLREGGRLIAPVYEDGRQILVLIEKSSSGVKRSIIGDPGYEVNSPILSGRYGTSV